LKVEDGFETNYVCGQYFISVFENCPIKNKMSRGVFFLTADRHNNAK
jgi:hypothetical protein